MLATMLFTMNTERKMDMNEKSWKPIFGGWGGMVPRHYHPVTAIPPFGGNHGINKESAI